MELDNRWSLPVISVLLLLFLLYGPIIRRLKARNYATLPKAAMVPWWDFFGVTLVLRLSQATANERLPEFFEILSAETDRLYGRHVKTMQMKFLGETRFTTNDPVIVQAILNPSNSTTLAWAPTESWEHSRALLRPSLVRNRIQDWSREEKRLKQMFDGFPKSTPGSWTEEFDLQPWFYKMTMDSTTEFFFDHSSDSLQSQEGSPNASFVQAFDRAQEQMAQRTNLGSYYYLATSRQFRRDVKVAHEWTDKLVQVALTRYEKRKTQTTSPPEEPVFLDELVEQTQDPIELRSQLLNVLLAGRDTTAGLLSWTFWLLARNPKEFIKLGEAVLDSFGAFVNPSNLRFEARKACKPLQNALKETLRLFPSVPFNTRQALKDTTLPTGGGPDGTEPIFVLKGRGVFYSVYRMQRDPDVWGPDAHESRPERWATKRAGWDYLPFNGGPQICLGQQFSLASASYYMVRMLQKFDDVRTSDERPQKMHIAVTVSSANGVLVRLHQTR